MTIQKSDIKHLLNAGIMPMPDNAAGEFPYYQDQSNATSVPSVETLMELLTKAVQKQVKEGAALMLSMGKDSVSLALAIQKADLASKIRAYTYSDSEANSEARQAAQIAGRLGITHHELTMPENASDIRSAMEHFFTHSPRPSCDPTVIPYATCLYSEGIKQTQIMDGTGNDSYAGVLMPPRKKLLLNFHKYIGRHKVVQNLRQYLPIGNKLNMFAMPFILTCFYTHPHFRIHEIDEFFNDDTNVNEAWNRPLEEVIGRSDIDIRTFFTHHFDQYGVINKAQCVAESLDCDLALPWMDKAVSNYYFHLPKAHKYNAQKGENKTLIRAMLAEYLYYDANAVGKHIFAFNREAFLERNEDFIRDEILGCEYWSNNIERFWKQYRRNPKAAGAIIDLFLVSGWLNHAKVMKEQG